MTRTALLLGFFAPVPAFAGAWQPTETLEPVFAVSSPPEAPVVAVNGLGNAIAAWDDTGAIRYAERAPGGRWTRGRNVRAGATGGPVAAALGADDTAAVAWVTVGTEFVPAKLVATIRAPGGNFPPEVEIAPGTGVYWFDLGVAGDGTAVIAWGDALGIETSTCPPGGLWSAPALVSDAGVAATLPDLAVNDLGDVVVAWQEGALGAPDAIGATYRLAGGAWEAPAIVSLGTGLATWNAKVGIDAFGDAALGWLDGNEMVVATRSPTGAWTTPTTVSDPAKPAYYPALAMSDQGELLAAWQVIDVSTSVWSSTGAIGATWSLPEKRSARNDTPSWPTVAYAGDGSVAAVSWVDDTAGFARVAIGTPGLTWTWTRTKIGGGSWGSVVPIAAGGGTVDAAWATQMPSNPNAAKVLGRAWE